MQTNNIELILMAGFALTLMLVTMPLVLAEENETNVTDSNQTLVNVTEDSNQTLDNETIDDINDDLNESVSSWDINWKRISILLTLNQEKKIKKEFDLARLRLIQARIAAKNNNAVAMGKALEAHDRMIAKIQKRIESLDGTSTANETRKSAEKMVGLDRAIQVHEARIQKLKDLIASDSNLTEEQIANIQKRIAKTENNTEHLRDVQEAKREKIKTKLMAIGNMSDDEAEDELHELEDAQNLTAVQKLIAEKRLAEAEKRLEEAKEKISEFQDEGKNTTAIELRVAELEQIIEDADLLIQEGKYAEAIKKLNQAGELRMELAKKNIEKAREQAKNQKEKSKFGKEDED